jgi:ATP-dependent DNA helicase RecQ
MRKVKNMKNSAVNALLKQYFGYDDFRNGQSEVIEHILKGNDVLAIMPTGAGKSICYQIPALMFEGVTIVISPLISLMKDQVDTLCETGIKAVFINSSLGLKEFRDVVSAAKMGRYKLIYVAPERLETDSFLELITSIKVSMVAVDEAHCVSQWGHDFRPSYREISKMLGKLTPRPVLAAFTATATPIVKDDIIKMLKLHRPFSLTTGFDRENLYFEVLKPANKFDQLLKYLSNIKGKSGIVYASTRKTVESICEKLNKKGYLATKYHAGLSENDRSKNQEDFIRDRIPIMVATNAFGMGIDKSNISFVIHNNMPKNMESYYQEAGRAGRDGERAECLLFYSASDIITNKLFIENGSEASDKTGEYQKLNEIVAYCNTDRCLRAYILDYFGEKDTKDYCDNCGNCNNDVDSTNVTLEAQKIMSCIKRMGERFGSVVVADVLRGSNTEKIRAMGFNKLTTYGIMKEYSKETIKELISFLIAESYITLYGDQYPVLRLNGMALEVLKGSKTVTIKRIINKQNAVAREKVTVDNGLFDILRVLRKQLADKQNVPPFVVFSDATLKDMCKKCPTSEEDMLLVSGVGAFKLEKYGEKFISAIKSYIDENKFEINEQVSIESKTGPVANMDNSKADKPKIKEARIKEPKVDTRLATYELYSSGQSIDEIAIERGLSTNTIEGHLLDCLEKGMQVDFASLFPIEFEPQILETIQRIGYEKLKAIKEALPDEITYGAIKFVLYKNKL